MKSAFLKSFGTPLRGLNIHFRSKWFIFKVRKYFKNKKVIIYSTSLWIGFMFSFVLIYFDLFKVQEMLQIFQIMLQPFNFEFHFRLWNESYKVILWSIFCRAWIFVRLLNFKRHNWRFSKGRKVKMCIINSRKNGY